MSKRPTAAAVPLIDDERVRVTRFEFSPGSETGWHRHEYDYVITAISDCAMRLEEPGGQSREVDVAAGESYRRLAGVEHNVVERGEAPMLFVAAGAPEVELK